MARSKTALTADNVVREKRLSSHASNIAALILPLCFSGLTTLIFSKLL